MTCLRPHRLITATPGLGTPGLEVKFLVWKSRDSKSMSIDWQIKKLTPWLKCQILTFCYVHPDTRPQPRQISDDVSRLKDEIDEQNRKTMELQSEIKRATENFRSSMPRQTFFSNMNHNNNNAAPLMRPSTGGGYRDYSAPYEGTNTKEHLERALEDSQVSSSLCSF